MGFFDQFTCDQLRTQYAKNARQLQNMVDTARARGLQQIRGTSVDYLQDRADMAKRMSTADDATVRAATSHGRAC